jgi:N-acetylmuramoyl-L-alanine amidase
MINDFAIYLLKTSLLLGVFYVVFELFFSRTTFFSLNRGYLVCALVLAFIVPLITISSDRNFSPVSELWPLAGERAPEPEMNASNITISSDNRSLGYIGTMMLVYFAVGSFLFIRCVFNMVRMAVLANRSPGKRMRRARVVRSQTNYSFSFFNVLFLSPVQSDHAVFVHEKAHIAQLHSVDLLIAELAVAFLWFNPVAWLMRKNIRLQHEYLADQFVLQNGTSLQEYLSIILKSAGPEETAVLINQFSSNPLKNRIVMMTTNKTTDWRKLTYFFTLPLVVFLLFAFANRDQSPIHKNAPITVVIDASHGGEDNGAVAGTTTEKELSLILADVIRNACVEEGVSVVMTRNGDQSISLADRIKTAKTIKADLFISVHFGFDNNPATNGVDCLISKENAHYESSLAFSSLLMDNLKSVVNVNGVKNTSALVLKENSTAAIILELGYLSNERDKKLISDPATQKAIGRQVAAAILAHKK